MVSKKYRASEHARSEGEKKNGFSEEFKLSSMPHEP